MSIGTVYPTYFDCDTATGDLTGANDPLITDWAHDRGVKVYARVNCQNTLMLNRILREPALRARTLDAVVSLAAANQYEGINLDFEAGLASDRDVYSSFVAVLASRLHAIGVALSVDVSPKVKDVPNHPRSTFYDYRALAAAADEVIVMAWGYHWATSAPGGAADLPWWTSVLNYTATVPGKQKFVICIPAYSRDWAAGGGPSHPGEALSWQAATDLAKAVGSTPVLDPTVGELHFTYTDSGTPHDVWMYDAATNLDRIKRAKAKGFSTALWRLGQEDPAIWAGIDAQQ